MNILNIIFKKKWKFYKNKKIDILLLDNNNTNFKIKNHKVKILNDNEINFFYIAISLIKFIFSYKAKYTFRDIYFITIVKSYDPKIGIGNEIDYKTYRFIKFFPKKQSIIYQFTYYAPEYKDIVKKRIINYFGTRTKKIKCNYFLVWNDFSKKYFDYFKTKFIVAGSVKNNEILTPKSVTKYDIMLISQFRRPVKSYYGTNRHYLTMKVQDASISYISKLLDEFSKKYNKKIVIALTSNRLDKKGRIFSKDELDFFKRDIKKFYTENITSLRLAEKSKLIVSLHSTLGPELLARGKKVFFLNFDHIFFNLPFFKSTVGPFWYKGYSKKKIFKKLKYLLSLNEGRWNKILQRNNIPIKFDQSNLILKKLLDKILQEAP